MNDAYETAYWLAVLAAAPWGRRETKQLIHRLCLEEGLALGALASGADAAAVARSGLTGTELGLLAACAPAAHTQQANLARLASLGIDVLRRDQPAYPENLSSRLGEEWLPYYLFVHGPLDLLTTPGCAILGAAQPDDAAQTVAQELGAQLAAAQWATVTCYDSDLARQVTQAALEAEGQAILLLAQGIERFLATYGDAGPLLAEHTLTLSPYMTTQATSPNLARASELLVAALCETLVLVAPDTLPADHSWVSALAGWGTRLWIWEGSGPECVAAWSAAGAQPFSTSSQVLGTVSYPLESQQAPLAASTTVSEAPTAEPYQTADEALAALGRGGNIPDVLAKRLRDLTYPVQDAPTAASDDPK